MDSARPAAALSSAQSLSPALVDAAMAAFNDIGECHCAGTKLGKCEMAKAQTANERLWEVIRQLQRELQRERKAHGALRDANNEFQAKIDKGEVVIRWANTKKCASLELSPAKAAAFETADSKPGPAGATTRAAKRRQDSQQPPSKAN